MLENSLNHKIETSHKRLKQLRRKTNQWRILPRSLSSEQKEATNRTSGSRTGSSEISIHPEHLLKSREKIFQALEGVKVAANKLCHQSEEIGGICQAVEAERQHYQDLFQNAPDAYLVTDLNTVILEANWAAAELLKCPQEGLVGQSLKMFISGLARSDFHRHLRRLRSGGATRNWEVYLRTRRSDPFAVTCTVAGVRNAQGKVVGLRWLLRDITDLWRTEEELRVLTAAMENAVEGISLLNRYGRYVTVNSAYAEQLGYQPKEIIGIEWQQTVHPEDWETVRAAYQQMLLSGKAEVEVRGVRKDGLIFYKDLVIVKVGDRLDFSGCYCFMKDITERKAAEERSRQQNEREQLIGGIAQRLLMSLNINEILNTVVGEVRNFLQVERVAIYQMNAGSDARFVVESVAPECPSVLNVPLQDPCFEAEYAPKFKEGYLSAVDDVKEAGLPDCYLKLLDRAEIRALLLVPIVFKGQLWGLLCAHQCSSARKWQQFEEDLLKSLATQLAIAIQQAELYQQLEAANQELLRMATSDGLTEVANRRRFNEYIEAEWQRLARDRTPLSLIMCDVDFFKLYNDTYGHQAGDECLKQVASAIARAVHRAADLVARYGGEEFAVVLPNTDADGAAHVAAAIQSEIKALEIVHAPSQVSEYVTLSLGVASTVPTQESSPATLIAAADEALYQAKEEGRDRLILIAK